VLSLLLLVKQFLSRENFSTGVPTLILEGHKPGKGFGWEQFEVS